MVSIDPVIAFGQRVREIIFRRFLIFLDSLGVTANGVTNSRLVLGLVFLGTSFFYEVIGFVIFVLTISMDMIDGALARYQGKASDRGKFLDIMVDYVVYSFILILFLRLNVNSYYICVNLVFVILATILAIVFYAEGQRTDWIIGPHPRLSFLKWLPIISFAFFVVFDANFMEWAIIVSNVIAIGCFIRYYLAVQVRWNRARQAQL